MFDRGRSDRQEAGFQNRQEAVTKQRALCGMKCLSNCLSGHKSELCQHKMMICALKIYNREKEFLLEAREWPVQVKNTGWKHMGKAP